MAKKQPPSEDRFEPKETKHVLVSFLPTTWAAIGERAKPLARPDEEGRHRAAWLARLAKRELENPIHRPEEEEPEPE